MPTMKNALILVDLQNDFCSGGNLAVPHGDEVIAVANRLQPYFDLVVATKDWHPSDHMSFASNHPNRNVGEAIEWNGLLQVLWPDHCVQDTEGANFHPQLDTTRIQQVFFKGIDKTIDSYSAFFDNAHLRATGLHDYLRSQHIETVCLLGLATDYCVKYSALDAARLNFNVIVIQDGCRAVNLQANGGEQAFSEMQTAGITLLNSTDIVATNQ
jgi:nicotinamidase/pyrazinamidase